MSQDEEEERRRRGPCSQASRLGTTLGFLEGLLGAAGRPRTPRRGLRARWLRGESQQEAREELQDSEVQEDEGGRALARMGGMAARLDPDVLLPGSLLPPSPRRLRFPLGGKKVPLADGTTLTVRGLVLLVLLTKGCKNILFKK